MKLKQELLLEQDVITGFSYSFCKALLEKLNKLSKKYRNNFFENGRMELITESVINHLQHQLEINIAIHEDMNVIYLMQTASEFLSIFEKEKKK